ncbi:ABC transporter permease [Rhizobium sp. RM]|jgi:arginine/ornithine transport system permease protein|uniref:ABC transporter permease n=1 Tax=Rhizobium/Agrobacterium group TaxID=227290 RepID=UPI00110F56A8|nr:MULTISPECIES: ABC transporter permease subunit [Rhizobium/Agrobacterium group]NWJ24339.1 ABC transporter permease subunit [Rhizobium sp. RM]TMV21110.1 ABC transporter permease subunit [Rhizobium sp. Td3]UXS04243.1 ABC transporter permease subunit [Agrobacterium tumefaciens]
MDFALIFENWPLFAHGLWVTVSMVGIALALGAILAIPLALVQAYNVPFLGKAAATYSYVFRGTPLLVQLYILYYGLAQFQGVRESALWLLLGNAYTCAIVGFTLNSAAYVAEIYRGALVSLDKGELEAAAAYGMTRAQVIRLIALPQAFRLSLPAYSNEVIFLLHASVVASTITIVDILGAGRKLNSTYYVVYEGFLTAAALYMVVVLFITMVFRKSERKFLAFR